MKKNLLNVGVVLTIMAGLTLPSCIGSFALTNRLLAWNNSVGNKFVNELVFFAFWVLPVYEVSALADVVVLNSIEFWSGENPMACGTKRIEGNDGQSYLVKCDGKGYDVISENDGTTVRLDFDADSRSWDVVLPSGESYELMTFVDDNHVSMPAANGTRTLVELSEAGTMAYQAQATGLQFAAR